MKKIPTLFMRDARDMGRVTDEINPACSWVWFGEGRATRKIDGTCCMIRDGKLFKRRELRLTDAPPPGYERADYDDMTQKEVGWVPVGDGPEDRYHREAFAYAPTFFGGRPAPDGTYELLGPKIQGNPERATGHVLIPHDDTPNFRSDPPRRHAALREWFETEEPDIEGIVWHHPDGRMCKIKARDFGLKRKGASA